MRRQLERAVLSIVLGTLVVGIGALAIVAYLAAPGCPLGSVRVNRHPAGWARVAEVRP